MNITKIIIFLGQFLKVEEFVSAIDLQHFIADEKEQGGYMLPLEELRLVLSVMNIAGFLEEIGNGVYTLSKKEYVKKEVSGAKFDTATNPLWTLAPGDLLTKEM